MTIPSCSGARRIQRVGLALLCCALGAELRAAPAADAVDSNSFDFDVGDTLSYDNNLYRVSPPAGTASTALGPGARREDYINRLSVGSTIHYLAGRQVFDVKLRADNNRYRFNDELNHVAGNGSGIWSWALGHTWTGRIGVIYDRELAAFANNLFLGKDMLTSVDYLAEVRKDLTPRWSVSAAGHWSQADHSASVRETEDLRSKTGSAGITYETPELNAFGVSYRYTDAHFPNSSSTLAGFDRDYTENAPKLWLRYAFSAKTDLDAQAGYLYRKYPNSVIGNFSGEFWRGTLKWSPTAKTQLSLSGWHELQAYIEAGSDYFVSQGFSITPAWAPTDRWQFSLQYSRDNQRFIGSTPVPFGLPSRHDRVYSTVLAASYTPQPWLEFGLHYRIDKRGTNRYLLDYKDDTAGVSVKFKF
jgi:hypothetical protein